MDDSDLIVLNSWRKHQTNGRVSRCLIDSIEMLETGLSALRRDVPTTRSGVMIERAEVVIGMLKNELNNLKGE